MKQGSKDWSTSLAILPPTACVLIHAAGNYRNDVISHHFQHYFITYVSSVENTEEFSCWTEILHCTQAIQFVRTQSRSVFLTWTAKRFPMQLCSLSKYLQFQCGLDICRLIGNTCQAKSHFMLIRLASFMPSSCMHTLSIRQQFCSS